MNIGRGVYKPRVLRLYLGESGGVQAHTHTRTQACMITVPLRPWRLARLADGMAHFKEDERKGERRNGGANDRRDFEEFMQEVR